MFDSENIPLVTRIESGPGVTVSFTVNSYGEGVYKARIDSDHIVGTVNKSFTFDVSALSGIANRLTHMETLLGIIAQPIVTVQSQDSDGIGFILYTQSNPAALAGTLNYRWRLLSFDENEIVSMRITVAAGTLAKDVLRTLLYTIRQNSMVQPYIREIRLDDSPGDTAAKISFKFNPIFARLKFDIASVTNTVSADASNFTVLQQVR